jgi:hypothetical protein
MVLQAGVMQPVGDLLVIALALGMAAFGYRHGLFLATLSGLGVLASYVVALAVSGLGAELAVSLGCPAPYALPAVFATVFGVCLVAVRLLVGATVPENAARLPPLIDALGGAAVGGVAGMAAAGAVLVGLSIAPLPADYQIDGRALRFDCGRTMLDTYAACLGADASRRQDLQRQYADHAWQGQARAVAPGGPAGLAGGTVALPPGQAPLISTPDEMALPADLADGGTVFQVRTVKQGEPIAFALRPAAGPAEDFALLAIDAQTGDVTVPNVERLRQAGSSIDVVLTATDQGGLSDEKTVTILLQP